MNARGSAWAAVLILVLLIGAAFLPVKDADFVSYDDFDYVTRNPTVLKGLHPAGFTWALTTFTAGNWHPLTWLSHMLDVSLFDLRPGAHHLTNLALHAATAVLLLLFLKRATGLVWPGFVAAALFAVHPLRVESVAWISERKDVLAGLFTMLTLLAYLQYLKKPGAVRYLATAALFALGLTAKPMLVTLPCVLLLLDWWPLGRFPAAGTRRLQPTGAGRLLLEKIPLLALTGAASVLTYIAQKRGGAMTDSDFFPLAVRLGNAVLAYVKYLGKMLWPRDLIYFYPHPLGTLQLWQVASCILLLTAITAVAFAARTRRPWLISGWLWYLGMLVPVIGIVQVGRQAMADRYSYLPLIGILVAIVWEARSRSRPGGRAIRALPAGIAALLAVLVVLTNGQARHWKNTQALAGHLLAVDPRNYLAHNLLGMDLLLRREPALAVAPLRRSLALNPAYQEARYNLGLALGETGATDEALLQFASLVQNNPRDVEAVYNLGLQHVAKGNLAEALALFTRALALEPQRARIHYDLGRTLDAMGRSGEAAARYRAALKLDPDDAEAHNNLGVTLAEQGRREEALEHFEAAVRLAPLYTEARANLERAKLAPP